ncbi:hypothetical protein E4U55_006381 [Claviceps digitariae]|nr:hypothetical protein E4U55_006381 [Claviceps digitariae]
MASKGRGKLFLKTAANQKFWLAALGKMSKIITLMDPCSADPCSTSKQKTGLVRTSETPPIFDKTAVGALCDAMLKNFGYIRIAEPTARQSQLTICKKSSGPIQCRMQYFIKPLDSLLFESSSGGDEIRSLPEKCIWVGTVERVTERAIQTQVRSMGLQFKWMAWSSFVMHTMCNCSWRSWQIWPLGRDPQPPPPVHA